MKLAMDKVAMRKIAVEAAALEAKGCDLNDGAACKELAQRQAEGYGVDKDAAKANGLAQKAMALLQKECEADDRGGHHTVEDASSCTVLGLGLMSGMSGVPKDRARARKLFEIGCDAKETLACKFLTVRAATAVGPCTRPTFSCSGRARPARSSRGRRLTLWHVLRRQRPRSTQARTLRL